MSRLAFRFGALAAAVAAFQPWLLLVLGETDVSSIAALAADPARSERIFGVMLLFMPCMFIAYWVASLDQISSRSLCGSLALFAFALWFLLELLPRSFDYWVVQGRWLTAFLSADLARRNELENAYRLYQDALFALLFVRRHALLLGQLCLAVLLYRERPWGLVLAIALGLSVLRLILGSLSSYGNWDGLAAVADPLYFVTAGLVFPLLSLWLWLRGNSVDARSGAH